MHPDVERCEIVNMVMEQKEIIKKASQRILNKIKNPQEDHNVDAEIVEILTAISNIGTITDDSK